MAASFSLSGTLRIVPQWTDDLNTTTVVDSATVLVPLTFANGTGADQANAFWKDKRTVAAAAQDFFQYSNLPLNVFGGTGTLNIATLKVVYVRNLSTTVPLNFERDESLPITIAPGGVLFWSASVSTSQPMCFSPIGSELVIANGGASAADYEIVLVGVKA